MKLIYKLKNLPQISYTYMIKIIFLFLLTVGSKIDKINKLLYNIIKYENSSNSTIVYRNNIYTKTII